MSKHTSMIEYTAMKSKVLTRVEREKAIIEYISNHVSCSPEEAVNGVSDDMSRQSFFNHLADLKKRKIIREENRNKRDKSLFVNSNDVMIKVMRELDQFEIVYFNLLKKIIVKVKLNQKPTSDSADDAIGSNVLINTLSYFTVLLTHYAYKLSIKWAFSISDKKYLERLQSYTLGRISNLFVLLYKVLKTEKLDDYIARSRTIDGNLDQFVSRTMKSIIPQITEEDKRMGLKEYSFFGVDRDASALFSLEVFSNYQ